MQVSDILLDCHSLNHGEGHGWHYYSSQSLLALAKALSLEPRATNFQELLGNLQPNRSGVDRAQTSQCYLVVDEFQRIAGENFRIVLEQARSFGLGAILANQTVSDLNTPSVDFTADDPDKYPSENLLVDFRPSGNAGILS